MKKLLSLIVMGLTFVSLAYANMKCGGCGAEMPANAKATKKMVDGKEVSVCEACVAAKK